MELELLNEESVLVIKCNGSIFTDLTLLNNGKHGVLSFLDEDKYVHCLKDSNNIAGLIVPKDLSVKVREIRPDIILFESDHPRYDFFTIYNKKAVKLNKNLPPSTIHHSAIIHESAVVAPKGVIIHDNVLLEPNVVIMPGVEIGSNSIIRSGAKIGVEGFEHKRTSKGIISVVHDGKVNIGSSVEIGANNTVAKGVLQVDTSVGDNTKTDCLVHIAHGTSIGKNCLIAASAMIAGSVVVGDDVWIGPSASISSQIKVGDNAFITLGSVVVRDVPAGAKVTGNFAIPHGDFIRILKNNLSRS